MRRADLLVLNRLKVHFVLLHGVQQAWQHRLIVGVSCESALNAR